MERREPGRRYERRLCRGLRVFVAGGVLDCVSGLEGDLLYWFRDCSDPLIFWSSSS